LVARNNGNLNFGWVHLVQRLVIAITCWLNSAQSGSPPHRRYSADLYPWNWSKGVRYSAKPFKSRSSPWGKSSSVCSGGSQGGEAVPSPLTETRGNRPPIRRDDAPRAKQSSGPFGDAATVEFGRFRVLLRQRVLLSETVPIALGTRAFDLLLALLEADGALVTKEELLSRVWPGIFVAEDNLKVQVSAVRKALGEDRRFIRTEFGRGYRFTAVIRATDGWSACQGAALQRDRRQSGRRVLVHRTLRRSNHGW